MSDIELCCMDPKNEVTRKLLQTLGRLKLYKEDHITITFFGTGIDLTGQGHSGTLYIDGANMGKLTEVNCVGGLTLNTHTVKVEE